LIVKRKATNSCRCELCCSFAL